MRRVDAAPDGSAHVAGDSMAVSAWTIVSRALGFLRVAAIAAVLGPTYLGNTFQITNVVPNLLFEFFTGSMLATVLVPPLVRALDRERNDVQRLAGAFLGLIVAGFAAVAVAGTLLAPLLVRLLTAGVGDPAVAADQRRVGLLLLVLVLPQVVGYAIAGVGAAVQNAHGRFALAAAAPAVESVGVMATLGAYLALYGSGTTLGSISTDAVLLLGLGSTGAVMLHAAVQWWGAWRVGVPLVPQGGWRRPEVMAVTERLRSALGYAGLNLLRIFAALVVVNAVEGGAVAFMLALNFYYLPGAIAARPVALALLPRLSRLWHTGAGAQVRDLTLRGTGMAAMVIVPAAVAYLTLALPLARAAAQGEMATSEGRALLAVSIAALAPGVVGEAAFVIGSHVAYALDDARAALRAIALRTTFSLALMLPALALTDGVETVAVVGLAISVGNIVGSWRLCRALGRRLAPGQERLAPMLRRAAGASLLMSVPAAALAFGIPALAPGRVADVAAMVAAAIVGAAVCLGVQRRWSSPELRLAAAGLRHTRTAA